MGSQHYYVVQVTYIAAQPLPAPVTHAEKKLAAMRGASWELWFINTVRATERDAAISACKLQLPEASDAVSPHSKAMLGANTAVTCRFIRRIQQKNELRVSKSYIIDHT